MTSLELIEKIRSGQDVRASEEALYGIVRAALLERIRQRIPLRLQSRLDPEDALHAAFLRARASLGTFKPTSESSFTAFVYQIAKNWISDVGDRRSVRAVRFGGVEDGPGGPRVSQVAGKQTGHTTEFGRREQVESLLSRLPPKEAEVIRLRDLEGRSYEEIAAAWQSTPGAVQRFHSRACDRLRTLAGEGGEKA